jgi:hypothetical protein
MVQVQMDKVVPSFRSTTDAAGSMMRPLGETSRLFAANAEAVAKVGPRANMSAREVEEYGKTSVRAATESEAAHKRAEAAYIAAHRQLLANMARLYEGALTTLEVMKRLEPAVKASFEPERIKTFNSVMDRSRQLGDELVAKMRDIKIDPPQLSTFDKLREGIKNNADELVGVARGALDVAQAFGGISRESAAALSSVINIGQAVAQMAAGNPIAGITGILGGVANIVSVMMNGDAARRKLIEQNNTELSRLRNELGNLSLNVSGDTFGKIQSALSEVMPQLKGGRGARNTTDVVNALSKRGIGMGDLKKLADQLGIRIYSDSGALSVDGLRQLLEAMGLVELGQFGEDYNSQLESVTTGFDVNKTGGRQQIEELGNLGGKFSPALQGVIDPNDLEGSRKRLAALFKKIQSGGITAADLGGMTGTEFLNFVTMMIGRIDSVLGSGGAAPAGSGGSSAGGAGDVVSGDTPGAGGVSMPVETVQAVIKAMNADVSNILTSHTALHERIAAATESSALSLTSIDAKMDTLIAVSGGVDRLDRALEADRYALAVQQGVGASF